MFLPLTGVTGDWWSSNMATVTNRKRVLGVEGKLK
jgi:hypothetical protein